MKPPEKPEYVLFGGTFVLANKLQFVGDKMVNGLSTKQWFLLRNIMDLPNEPPPTITQIAREIDSTRQNTTKMLEVMERDGLVTIEENDIDRRSRCVRITELGLKNARQIAANAQDFLSQLYEGISLEELDIAGGVLKHMIQNLMTMQEELK